MWLWEHLLHCRYGWGKPKARLLTMMSDISLQLYCLCLQGTKERTYSNCHCDEETSHHTREALLSFSPVSRFVFTNQPGMPVSMQELLGKLWEEPRSGMSGLSHGRSCSASPEDLAGNQNPGVERALRTKQEHYSLSLPLWGGISIDQWRRCCRGRKAMVSNNDCIKCQIVCTAIVPRVYEVQNGMKLVPLLFCFCQLLTLEITWCGRRLWCTSLEYHKSWWHSDLWFLSRPCLSFILKSLKIHDSFDHCGLPNSLSFGYWVYCYLLKNLKVLDKERNPNSKWKISITLPT